MNDRKKWFRIIKCRECHKTKRHEALGLCSSCYKKQLWKRKHLESPLIHCNCGNCDDYIHSISTSGRKVYQSKGHHQKIEENKKYGKDHHRFKTGVTIDDNGYELTLCRDHPFANNNGYIRVHRLIYELYYGCNLLPWIVIHHINGNKQDNSITNLQPLTRSIHMSIHFKKDTSDWFCSNPECKSPTKTTITNGYLRWHDDHKGGHECHRCNRRDYGRRRRLAKSAEVAKVTSPTPSA